MNVTIEDKGMKECPPFKILPTPVKPPKANIKRATYESMYTPLYTALSTLPKDKSVVFECPSVKEAVRLINTLRACIRHKFAAYKAHRINTSVYISRKGE